MNNNYLVKTIFEHLFFIEYEKNATFEEIHCPFLRQHNGGIDTFVLIHKKDCHKKPYSGVLHIKTKTGYPIDKIATSNEPNSQIDLDVMRRILCKYIYYFEYSNNNEVSRKKRNILKDNVFYEGIKRKKVTIDSNDVVEELYKKYTSTFCLIKNYPLEIIKSIPIISFIIRVIMSKIITFICNSTIFVTVLYYLFMELKSLF